MPRGYFAMRGNRLPRVTEESWLVGPDAAYPRPHQDRARQDGGGLEQILVAQRPGLSFEPLTEALQRHLPNDKAAIVAIVVDVMWIPFAETIIGPLVGGMIEIIAARIEGQFVEQIEIEAGVRQDR